MTIGLIRPFTIAEACDGNPTGRLAYTLLLNPNLSKPDGLAVIDVKPGSPTYTRSSTW